MCGITGYIGNRDSTDVVTTGLENLEYRGYDSAGVALVDSDLDVFKREGTIDGVSVPRTADANRGLGHTRWSTHGEPTDENAHPHTDCHDEIAVVHNGVIANFDELKRNLRDRGHVFDSDTDTEVIPHLIEEERREGWDLLAAVRRVIDEFEGSFAIAATTADYDGLVAARQDSPLVVGHGEDGTYLASDVTAFVEFTQEVTFIEDGDVVDVTADGITVYNDGTRVERDTKTVDWEAEDTTKAGHDHYMHKEIHEQPSALRQALAGRVDAMAGEVDLDLALSEHLLKAIERVHIVACGTSYHAGLYARHLLERIAGVPTAVTIASEFEVTDAHDPQRTLTLAISQSGETADTLSAVRQAKAVGTTTLALTNTVGSTVTREVDDSLFIRAGPEIGVAATKTFVSQVATLTMLAVEFARARNTLSADEAADVLADLADLPSAVQQVLDDEAHIRRLAETYVDGESYFFIGRAVGHPVALEAALKLKEISYDHAEGFPGGELKHGPLALVTPDTPVIAILTAHSRAAETLTNVKEVESRGAPVIGCGSHDDATAFCTDVIDVPEVGYLEPLVANVALQLFAYHVATLQDRPIDKPRNLAKSVTVE